MTTGRGSTWSKTKMAKKLTRTGFKMRLSREFNLDVGSELQAIGTLIRLMSENGEMRIPFSKLNAFPESVPVVRRILHWLVAEFNAKHPSKMDELSSGELDVAVELGVDVDGNDILLALGDRPESKMSTVYLEG